MLLHENWKFRSFDEPIFSRKSLIWFYVIVLLGAGVTLYRTQTFGGTGTPTSLDVNIDCSPCASETKDYCNLDLQYTKFIWFITDGWAYFRFKPALELYKNNSIIFTHSVIGQKWSHSIYTSWWTGLPPRNIFAFPVLGDQLWESLVRADGERCHLELEQLDPTTVSNPSSKNKIVWIGPDWSPITVGGGVERFTTFYNFEVRLTEEHWETAEDVYQDITLEKLPTILEDIAAHDQSLIAHAGVYDKSVHYAREDSGTKKRRWGEDLVKYFSNPILKNFIDAHPDYLLILSSDHGNSEIGSPYFHGEEHTGEMGNIGFVVLYGAGFQQQDQTEIHVVDVLPTICKYLKNCDIPFHNSGIFHGNYGNNSLSMLNALKQNLNQLIKVSKYHEYEYDYASMENLLETGTISDIETIKQYAEQLKKHLYEPQPIHKVILVLWIIAALGLLGFGASFLWKINRNNRRLCIVFLLILLPMIVAAIGGFKEMPIRYFAYGGYGLTEFILLVILNLNQKTKSYLLLDFGMLALLWEITLLLKDAEITVFVGFLGSALFTVVAFHSRRLEPLYRRVCVGYGVMLMMFFPTIKLTWMYCIAGFHVVAFGIYATAAISIIYLLFTAQWELIGFHVAALLMLVRAGDIAIVVLIVLHEYLFPKYVALISKAEGASQLFYQTMIIYLVMYITWFFAANHSTFDWEINPMWGAMGIDSWNRYPSLSGAFMGFGKIGIFLVNTFFLLHLFTKTSNKNNNILQYALLWTGMIIFMSCLSAHIILATFSPVKALQAMFNMISLMTFNLTIWVLHELLIKKIK